MIDIIGLIVSSIVLGVYVTLLWVTLQPGAIIAWFIWRRWQFMVHMNELLSRGWQPGREINTLSTMHNNNLCGCRKHPIIYNDMCRIVRGVK